MRAMGVLFDYFSAASDELAAKVIDSTAGPSSSLGQDGHVLDTVSLKGIEPVVQLGTLEQLLTGVPYDDVVARERSGLVLADRDGGNLLILSVTDEVQAALAVANRERLAEVAVPWSETEEFSFAPVDPRELAVALEDLAGLARRAGARGQRMYCWVCV